MVILSANPMWEAFGLRALPFTLYGGAHIANVLLRWNVSAAMAQPMTGIASGWLPQNGLPLIQRGLWVHGVNSLLDFAREIVKFEISPVIQNITCPTLLTVAEGDPIAAEAQKLYDALRCPKTLMYFTGAEGSGEHCEALARGLYHQRVFDWLDETLGIREHSISDKTCDIAI